MGTKNLLQNSLGISKDKTALFMEYRQAQINRKTGGYKRKWDIAILAGSNSNRFTRNKREESFLSTVDTSVEEDGIELNSLSSTQAPYVPIFDQTMDKLS